MSGKSADSHSKHETNTYLASKYFLEQIRPKLRKHWVSLSRRIKIHKPCTILTPQFTKLILFHPFNIKILKVLLSSVIQVSSCGTI